MNSVKVAIRVRPLISRENGDEVYWTHGSREIKSNGRKDPYIFDRVFGTNEETRDVYKEIVAPIVDEAMKGFNGTVFAYGQTSSGKTYTMMGSPDGKNPGIIPMAVGDIFSHIQNTPEREFLLRVSYVEIYNEVLKDLLVPVSDTTKLEIRADKFRNVVVQGLKEKMVTSEAEVLDLMRQGDRRRRVGDTNMNERSSRSHTIFRMILESHERVDAHTTEDLVDCETAVKMSQLNFVDLAGSERPEQTGAEGQRFKEGCKINTSLSALGTVINQICEGSTHKSFRNSKLTRILAPSLGGNALTAIICAVTPVSFRDTDSTLRFASNAKKMKNEPCVNEALSDEAVMFKQKREINDLKKRIHELESNAKQMILTSSQPSQRSIRRGAWAPGLKPELAGSSKLGSPKGQTPTFNQSSLLNRDHGVRDVNHVFVFPPVQLDAANKSQSDLVETKELLHKNEHLYKIKKELEEADKKLKEVLDSKEKVVSRLEIQLEHAKEPLQRENGRLKDELKLCKNRIENLKQQVKMVAIGKGSVERLQPRVERVYRSNAAASQPGVPFDSRMCLLEIEVAKYKSRSEHLEMELGRSRDIEKKRL